MLMIVKIIFLGLAYGCKNNIIILEKFAFADRVFTLMLVYRKKSTQMQEFF